MTVVRYEPWGLLNRLRRELDETFENTAREATWSPAVDIHEEAKQFVVHADLPGVKLGEEVTAISAKTGFGLDMLKRTFLEHVNAMRGDDGGIVITNARHVEALVHARNALGDAKHAIEKGISGELLATDLRRAQHHLGEITGKITPDDLLGSIFGRFCIGK